MSYILDSIKKSDRERRTVDHSSTMVMRSPAFLENDKPSHHRRYLFLGLALLLSIALIYFMMRYWQDKTLSLKSSVSAPEPQALVQKQVAPVSSSELTANTTKAEAIALYKQALAEKSRPEIDSLYAELKDKQQSQLYQTTQESQETALPAKQSSELVTSSGAALEQLQQERVDETSVAESLVSNNTSVEPEQKAALIPSIYELDAYFRKTIPSISYGAHIYATDNNSGFVILDGARRRVGDKLDSGLFIEQIQEEQVILSYNGTLFALPAMKSWQGN